ncbi:MAG: DNA topoisomerase I [Gemmatimonadetes bacterium]|nr:DNA topoisomerase I [Gemmatimonadota bacterium]|tara:strand:+ start:5791 stop:8073 length:2283 start_codon:yes stop_codon:yes gene_type:complete
MAKNLIIVESPAKARTIANFVGKEYKVVASMGHIRDLPARELGFNPEQDFVPNYEVPDEKRKIIRELKKEIDKDTTVYLATDEDREGESISWHLISALKIEKNPIRRIVFHEITKRAIEEALANPRDVDQSLVDAQQARRLVDRAVGYNLSPLLWRKIKGGLSAGRVQSVAVRILVEREREIRAFKPDEFWKIKAMFESPSFQSELSRIDGKQKKVPNEEAAKEIDRSARAGTFLVKEVAEREGRRKPVAPFITSTLQQEASRKLSFSVAQTMRVAQQLYEGNFEIPGYEGGLITYMRTDSVNLSDEALSQAHDVIVQEYGDEYAVDEPRTFKTTGRGAQEAHEAIRPSKLSIKPSDVKDHLTPQLYKLYDLVWKRTLATQMEEARILHTTLKIEAGEKKELLFETKGQRILFPGFLKAYTEGSDDPDAALEDQDVILPKVEEGQILDLSDLELDQNFTKPPPRYTEASLVKKLESEGIGRPSTYAPIISTIQDRGYVERTRDRKLRPTATGEVVNDFLVEHFSDIVDVGFTIKIEDEFDEIAKGGQSWQEMMREFYPPFVDTVTDKDKNVDPTTARTVRVLGDDPKTGRPVSVRLGKFGPMVQIGTREDEEKPLFASVPNDKDIYEVELDEALGYFAFPRTLGEMDGEEVLVNHGRYGYYVRIGREYFSLEERNPTAVELDEAIQIIKEGRENKTKNVIKDFGEVQVLNGRYGPYIKKGGENYRIPKGTDPSTLDLETCEQLMEENGPTRRRGRRRAAS